MQLKPNIKGVFFILLSRRKRIMEGWTQKENMICAKNESSGSGKTPGITMKINSSGKLGQGQWIVAEADESDGSFVFLPSTIGIINNIDLEHFGDSTGELSIV